MNQFQSSIRTPEGRTAALTTAEQDIDSAKRLVLSMLTRRNMFVPISTLPAEILSRIFHFYVSSVRPYSHTLRLGRAVAVTHVCRHWRQVALDDSTLWTHFLESSYFPNEEWIAERLSRARNAPLVVEFCQSTYRDTASLFTPHISHTRELYLRNLPSFNHSVIMHRISTQKTPALERLEISISEDYPVSFRHSFFDGPFPKLRTFCVSQIVYPWSFFPRGQLTQLKVTLSDYSEPRISTDLDQLIDLLVNCPALEVLSLENCLPAALSESSGGQTIHLPHLSRLCLTGSSSHLTNLFKMLKLSSSTSLRLNCTLEAALTHNEHVMLLVLSAHFNNPIPIEFRSLKINLHPVDGVVNLVASTSLPTLPIPHPHIIHAKTDVDAELSLSLSRLSHSDGEVIVRRACEVLPISKLEFLSIVAGRSVNWGEVFRPCTEVTTVQLCGDGLTNINLLSALGPPNDYDNNNSVSAPAQMLIFPKLRSLFLHRLMFNQEAPGSGLLHDFVLSVVKRREATKAPLRMLSITGCVISA